MAHMVLNSGEMLGAQGISPTATKVPPIGYSLNGVILPLQIAQCESVYIFFDIAPINYPAYLWMWPPYALDQPVGAVLTIHFPPDVGYLQWTCNIPAGVSFFIEVGDFQYYGIVQPGTSSSCLGPLSVNYTFATYETVAFEVFTQTPFPTASLAAIPNPYTTPSVYFTPAP
jgi:hypothetical protein